MTAAVLRWLDVRSGEGRHVAVFFVGLLTIVVGHTLVETARDALFLLHVGPRDLGGTYVVNAAMALAGGAASARLTMRLGPHRALLVAQLVAAIAVAAYFLLPPTRLVLGTLFGLTALVGTVLVPQLWAAAAVIFHATQGRRLFAVIALAGVLGATLGSAVAAGMLLVAPVEWLLLLGSASFVVSAAVTARAPRGAGGGPVPRATGGRAPHPFREEPILKRIALATALGAVTALLVDYAYKVTIVRTIPAQDLAGTLALVGLVTNALAFAAQLGLARRVVERAGVVGAYGFASSLLLLTSGLAVLSGGGLLAVIAARVADGASRHSVHRTATELLYLAVPPAPRNGAKPFIEGAVARVAQAVIGGALLVAATLAPLPIPLVALLATAAAAAWGAATYSLWKPYVALLRRSLGAGALDPNDVAEQLDLASADVLVEALGGSDPRQVSAALAAFARRGRVGLVPALVLLHEDEDVLVTALEILATTNRRDWTRHAERLARDKRWRVRRAALRALTLARAQAPDVGVPIAEDHPWTRGYVAIQGAATVDEAMAAVATSDDARETLLGALTAIADRAAAPDLEPLLIAVAHEHADSRDEELVEAIAGAAAKIGARRLLPWLVTRVGRREGRAAVQRALVSLEAPAFDALVAALRSGATRRERVQLPRVIALFGTPAAAKVLFDVFSSDPEGLVRYRCLRALDPLVHRRVAAFSIADVRPLAHRAMAEHFRMIGLRVALGSLVAEDPSVATAHRLLARLLAEKAQQSLMRAYLAIGLAFPDEDLRRAHDAATGGSAPDRAAAAELIDALLVPKRGRRAHDALREWLRLAVDDLPDAERAARAGASVAARDVAVRLADDGDPVVRALAAALAPDAPAQQAARG